MTIRWFILIFLLTGQPFSQAAERWVEYEYITNQTLRLPKLSIIGKKLLKDTSEWEIGRSEHFTVFAYSRHQLQAAVDEAENAYKRAGDWFNLDTESIPMSVLVFVKNGEKWDKLMRGYGLRRDSLAMQLGRELYFREDPDEQRKPERISHEVLQLALNQEFAPRIPLWVEEGLASHFGWICAVEMFNTRGLAISRTKPVFNADDWIELDELLSMRKYPKNEAKARAFYRQAEELIAVLAERLDASQFARFVHKISTSRSIGPDEFKKAAGLADSDMDGIVRAVWERCTEAEEQ